MAAKSHTKIRIHCISSDVEASRVIPCQKCHNNKRLTHIPPSQRPLVRGWPVSGNTVAFPPRKRDLHSLASIQLPRGQKGQEKPRKKQDLTKKISERICGHSGARFSCWQLSHWCLGLGQLRVILEAYETLVRIGTASKATQPMRSCRCIFYGASIRVFLFLEASPTARNH